jgi:hypothetical protein
MLGEYRDAFPSTILRFAALFSDWCEYPPLFVFLDTWLSETWNARMLGGRGRSAIPYLHIRDGVAFVRRVIARADDHEPEEVLIGSGNGAVSHEELFDSSTRDWYGTARDAIHMPKLLCGPGMHVRWLVGRLTGREPFERPWMARYIDQSLTVDASRTHRRLDWTPRDRLDVLRRLPFLLVNRRSDPIEWNRRNRAAMKEGRLRPNLTIHRLMRKHERTITERIVALLTDPTAGERFRGYREMNDDVLRWYIRLVLSQLTSAVLTRQRAVFIGYCRDLGERRHAQGFRVGEVTGALRELNRICVTVLSEDPESRPVRQDLHDCVTMNFRFGCDQIEDVYDELGRE